MHEALDIRVWQFGSYQLPAKFYKKESQLQRSKKQSSIRGLNSNHNPDLKNLFKSASAVAAIKTGPFQKFAPHY